MWYQAYCNHDAEKTEADAFSIDDDEDTGNTVSCFMISNKYDISRMHNEDGVILVVHGYSLPFVRIWILFSIVLIY